MIMVTSRAYASVVASLLAVGVVAACSGSNTTLSGFQMQGNSDGGGGGGGDSGQTFNTDGGFQNLGDGGGNNNGGDAACAATSTKAQQRPLDMYIMLDQSGSMSDTVAGGGTKWSDVTQAINTFVSSPAATGISVGLQFFAVPASGGMCPPSCNTNQDCGSNGPCVFGMCAGCVIGGSTDSCNAADYAMPAVEIAPLPGNAGPISMAISQHGPSTNTPTSAALQGAINHASDWAKAHTMDVVIDVLATDGDPTECDTSLTDIDAIAAAGVAATPKILTFVIGVGSSTSNLNGIAAAGGTTNAFIVDTNMNVNQQFLMALNQIRGAALGCTYSIPVPASGMVDYTKVNVQYTPGNGGAPMVIPQVQDMAHCPSSGDAWYYDNPAAPTQIILCSATCMTVSADAMGEIDVLTGCKTVIR